MGKNLNSEIDNTKLKILICCHKPCELPPDPDGIFLPIQVGAAISDIDLGMQRDDQVNGQPCDNISVKNKSFCELTAMYWAWKNIKKLYPDLEYIGLNHYRRYFSFDKRKSFSDVIILPENEIQNYVFNLKKVKKYLEQDSIIMSTSRIYQYPLEVDYSVCHFSDDLRIMKRIVHKRYPEYDQDVYKVMSCGNKLSPCNMFIMKWEFFDTYCKWLFDILFEAEYQIDITKYNEIQRRVFGYIAERFFNVWIYHNVKNVKKNNIVFFTEGKIESSLICFLRFIRNMLCGYLLKPKVCFSEEKYCQINNLEMIDISKK